MLWALKARWEIGNVEAGWKALHNGGCHTISSYFMQSPKEPSEMARKFWPHFEEETWAKTRNHANDFSPLFPESFIVPLHSILPNHHGNMLLFFHLKNNFSWHLFLFHFLIVMLLFATKLLKKELFIMLSEIFSMRAIPIRCLSLPFHCIALVKGINNFHVLKSKSLFSAPISLDTPTALDTVAHTLSLDRCFSLGCQDSMLSAVLPVLYNKNLGDV